MASPHPQNAQSWHELRAWLEAPQPGAPGLTRSSAYCLKRVLRTVKASSTVARYLTRQQHRGQEAQPPTWAQLLLVLPVFSGPAFVPTPALPFGQPD